MTNCKRLRPFFEDDGGFSTVGMVLALLVSVSLIIGATQVYKLRSVAADVQNVADVCALAAEKQVASFYIVAQVCDSAVLSLSMAGLTSIGLGIVAACIPPTQAISVKLVEAGERILEARTRFSNSCIEGLNKLQALLPIFAALDAAALAQSNAESSSNYYAIAVLAPFEGKDLVGPSYADEDELAGIEQQRDGIATAALEAEEAAQKASEHKLKAFMADCGSAPSYCMYERAATLAGLSGQANPHYGHVDSWSFSVALTRARAYYAQRLWQEAPATDSVEEQARSAIRMQLYDYAVEQMNAGYVYETADSFEAYFPLLPRNTEEMRQTRLYTDNVYPVTENEEGVLHMHAWPGCPAAAEETFSGFGSVALYEAEGLPSCEVCEFSAASVGRVASASTSIENGFEYHYRIVAHEAELYQQEYETLTQQSQKVKNPAENLLETIGRLLTDSLNYRIKVEPPGHVGAIAIVVDSGGVSAADLVPNSMVGGQAYLGTRVAFSAATLANDDASESDTVISSFLDGFLADTYVGAIPDAALDLWSSLLVMYSKGNRSLSELIESSLNSLPLVGASGLGTWASNKFQGVIEDMGFEPPDLVSHKPVLVNTYHVAKADQNAFTQGLLGAKQAFSNAYGGIAQDPLAALVGVAGGQVLTTYDSWDATFVVAHIELFGEEGPSIPLEISLPPALKDAGGGLVEQAISNLYVHSGQSVELRRWD